MAQHKWDSTDISDQNGRVAIVTGSSSGIGFETARVLAVKNATVIIAVRNLEKGNKAADKIKDDVPKADLKVMELDLASLKSVRTFSEKFRKEYSRLDLLINNAGVGMGDYFDNLPHEFYEKMMVLNMVSLVCLTRLFLPELKRSSTASILNSGSLAGFFPSPYKSVYAASKSFVNMFSLALREELCRSGVSVSVLCPGSVLTNDAVKKRVPKNGYLARAAVLSSERVARTALNNMEKGKALIIPGFVNKLYYFTGFAFPFKLRVKFLSRLFRKYYLSGNGN